MIRLATRATLAGGKEAAARLVLTALGVALGVTLLLFAAVAFPALHAHDVRNGWLNTSAHNVSPSEDESRTDPLLWRVYTDRYENNDIIVVDVAPEGPRAPLPAWLPRWPRAGELAASPSMAKLLRTTDPALLGDRYPGRVTLTVGKQALLSPSQLVVVRGRTPDELRAAPSVVAVRSIETAPIKHNFSDFLRIVLVVGGLGLLVPVLVFVSTATRLAAARREQRLAAMRLAGATPGQAGVVAAVEAGLVAVVGAVLGFVAFFVARPYVARVPFDGHAFYVSDLHLALGWAVLIAIGVPALAVAAALVSLHRVRISPLGVTRQQARGRPSAWRVLVLGGGLVLFAVTLTTATGGGNAVSLADQAAVGLGFVVIVVGIVACGPWLTAMVARGMGRVGQRAPGLLAARRLQDNPAAGFRAISGLVLAVFVASFVSALAASASDLAGFRRPAFAASTVGIAATSAPLLQDGQSLRIPAGAAPPEHQTIRVEDTPTLLHAVARVDGVQRVVDVRALPAGIRVVTQPYARIAADHPGFPVPVGLVRCTDARALAIDAPCTGSIAIDTNVQLADGRPFVVALDREVPASELDRQPLLGVAVFTDGDATTIERVRTKLETSFPGAPAALTGSDLEAQANFRVHDIAQLSNVALALTLVIAGCSLAVAVAGGLVERKRPFALLRLTGMPLRDLHRVVLAEAAAPLLVVAAVSVGLGFLVDTILLAVIGQNGTFRVPSIGYWGALAGGLAVALVVVAATLPLLDRLTSLETARFE